MNKLGLILGVAAVATFSGCLDPNYHKGDNAQNEPKDVQVKPAEEVKEVKPVDTSSEKEIVPVIDETPVKSCTCPAGTVHDKPCTCGAPDCKCQVKKTVEVKPVAVPAEPEYTTYIVQRGDYLSKISKKYNIKVDAIKKINNMTDDKIRIGQKIKLPGKVEVGEQTVPAGAVKVAAPVVKEYKPYAGATKEYVVKSGDTLGAIAYGNGINIRQLKELNGLSGNVIRVGQKLKIPAAAAAAAVAPAVEAKPVVKEEKPVVVPAAAVETAPVVAPAASVETAPVAATPAEPVVATPAPAPASNEKTYVVQEGEDLLNLSLKFSLSPAEIRSLNNLGEDDQLTVGQTIKLPADTPIQ